MGTSIRWRNRERLPPAGLPAGLQRLLLEQGSLLRRLKRLCRGPVAVRLIAQRWKRPAADQRAGLELRAGERVLVREVILECAGVPWVYARSIIPARTLRGPLSSFSKQMATRPLGSVLFGQPRSSRGALELARLTRSSTLHTSVRRTIGYDPEELWARRSLFRVRGRPLVIVEVFLPPLTSRVLEAGAGEE